MIPPPITDDEFAWLDHLAELEPNARDAILLLLDQLSGATMPTLQGTRADFKR